MKRNSKGLSISLINYIMIIIASVVCVLVLIATIKLSNQYDDLIETTNRYIECVQLEAQVKEGSSYLTEEVRLFVMNMKLDYVYAYFEELNNVRRRDSALEQLKLYQSSEDATRFLDTAIENAKQLTEREIYAMKLIAEANNFYEKYLPEEICNVELSEKDAALSSEKKITKARSLVLDTGYQNYKSFIDNDVAFFINDIIDRLHVDQQTNVNELRDTISRQRFYICVLFILDLFIFSVVAFLVVRPLRAFITQIKNDKMLDVKGAYEFQYLAITYNNIYELNAANEALLRHKADHDALTGIMNRGSFDQMKQILCNGETPLALMQIDVDKFKNINDTYGHEAGDKVLQKVGNVLLETFRSTDFPCRIGGDEFAVIMTGITIEHRDIIVSKIESMQKELLNNMPDGLPGITLSIGIAFAQNGFEDDLSQNADAALYIVKNNGRNGYCFYDESENYEKTYKEAVNS